tara:strand:+ start:218 stop:532 length:315 start_codon:yes stop_codon:yes gene_type:complete
MKIAVIGDFHGKFPKRLISKVRKENPDLILSQGDFCGDKRLAKLFFKYVYGKHEDDVSRKIEKEIERFKKISLKKGLGVLSELKKLKKTFLCGSRKLGSHLLGA